YYFSSCCTASRRRNNTVRNLRFYGLAALLVVLGGCIGGRSSAPEYHMLTARAQSGSSALTVPVGVGPVRVAPFLSRPPIVTHAGGGSLQMLQNERWGEPLD